MHVLHLPRLERLRNVLSVILVALLIVVAYATGAQLLGSADRPAQPTPGLGQWTTVTELSPAPILLPEPQGRAITRP